MSIFEESKSYRPFQYSWAVEAAQKHSIEMYWDIHQVNLQDDTQQYFSKNGLATQTVSHEQNKNILDRTLCLFTEMDRTVGAGYTKLMAHVKNNEIRNMFLTFAAREVVHQRAYALCAETFGFSDQDWIAFADYVEMVDKLDVMSADMTPEGSSEELKTSVLLAQILLGEGIGLFAAFATLLNMCRHGILIGFNDVNEWSLKDEQEHVTNNIRTLKEARKSLSELENAALDRCILSFVDAYKKAEHKFIDLVYEMGGSEGMTADEMKDYITYLCDFREYQLELRSMKDVGKNPLEWMEWVLSGSKHGNFFEKKITDYSHGGLPGNIDYSKYLHLAA